MATNETSTATPTSTTTVPETTTAAPSSTTLPAEVSSVVPEPSTAEKPAVETAATPVSCNNQDDLPPPFN